MNFPEYVAFTLDRLEENGYSAYLVGGCVRDFLMGIVPHDFDITTCATPEQIENCFSDIKTLDVGKKHGTITLVFDKECVEVTTYRIDGEYIDSRHPETVTFTDRIEDDLSRRDFTMNAIAYSPQRGFVDPFGGKSDIEKRKIVCVGNPSVRFEEDALRIMRGLRFSSRLGFEIEEETLRAMVAKKDLLCNIASERIREEFVGILNGRFVSEMIFSENSFFEILSVIIPEVNSVDFGNLHDFLMQSYEFEEIVRLCAFFCSFTPETAFEILHRLRFDNRTIKTVTAVVSNVESKFNVHDEVSLKKSIAELTEDVAYYLYMTLGCVYKWVNEEVSKCHINAAEKIRELVKRGECVSIKQLDIKGNEIIDVLGINPSMTGKMLERLLCDVIEEKVNNSKDALIARAQEYIA